MNPLYEQYLRHVEVCGKCDHFTVCTTGAYLLQRAADDAAQRLAPMPPQPGRA